MKSQKVKRDMRARFGRALNRRPLVVCVRDYGFGAAMNGRGVLIHRPSCLGAAVSVPTAKIGCDNGIVAL